MTGFFRVSTLSSGVAKTGLTFSRPPLCLNLCCQYLCPNPNMSEWIGEASDSDPNGRVQVPIVIVNDGATRADPIADLKVAGDVVCVCVCVCVFLGGLSFTFV